MSLRNRRNSQYLGTWLDGPIRVHSFRPIITPLQSQLPVFTFGPIIPKSLVTYVKEDRCASVVHAMAFPYAHNGFAYVASRLTSPKRGLVLSPWLKERIAIPRYLRAILRKADAIIAQTEWEKKKILDVTGDPSRIFRLPAGVGPEFCIADGSNIRSTLPFPPGSRLLLFAGRMTRAKGFFDVIEALRLLPNDINLIVLGRPSPQAGRFLERTGPELTGRIHFAGYVPDVDVPKYFAAADLVVYPSSDDSFGMVFLEAMRAGKVAVGCAVGGPKELLRPGWDSEVVAFGQPRQLAKLIERLLNAPKKLKKMGFNAKSRANRMYDWNIITKRLLEIFEYVSGR